MYTQMKKKEKYFLKQEIDNQLDDKFNTID